MGEYNQVNFPRRADINPVCLDPKMKLVCRYKGGAGQQKSQSGSVPPDTKYLQDSNSTDEASAMGTLCGNKP